MQLSPRASRCPHPPELCSTVPASSRRHRPSCPLAVADAPPCGDSARPRGLAPGRQRSRRTVTHVTLPAPLARLGFPEPEAPRPSSTSRSASPAPSPTPVAPPYWGPAPAAHPASLPSAPFGTYAAPRPRAPLADSVAGARGGLFAGPRGPRALASLPLRRLRRLPRGDTARSHLAVDLLGTASMPPRRSVTRRTRQHPASLVRRLAAWTRLTLGRSRYRWLAARLRALPSAPSAHRGVRSREAAPPTSHRCNVATVPFPCARGMSRRALPNPRTGRVAPCCQRAVRSSLDGPLTTTRLRRLVVSPPKRCRAPT